MERAISFAGWAIVGMVIGILLLGFGADFFKTMKNGSGWIWQGRYGVSVQEFTKEENGCISYIDSWGREGKTCGDYRVEKYK